MHDCLVCTGCFIRACPRTVRRSECVPMWTVPANEQSASTLCIAHTEMLRHAAAPGSPLGSFQMCGTRVGQADLLHQAHHSVCKYCASDKGTSPFCLPLSLASSAQHMLLLMLGSMQKTKPKHISKPTADTSGPCSQAVHKPESLAGCMPPCLQAAEQRQTTQTTADH